MLNDKVRPVQVDPIMLSRFWKDPPRDGGIPKIPAVDEGEAVDNTAHYDQPSVNAMDDLPLLSVRVYWVIVKSQTGRIRGGLMIESIPAVGAVVASFLVGFGVHDEKVTLSVPHSRHWGLLDLCSKGSFSRDFPTAWWQQGIPIFPTI